METKKIKINEENIEILPISIKAGIKISVKKISFKGKILISLIIHKVGEESEIINMELDWHKLELTKKQNKRKAYVKAISKIILCNKEEEKNLGELIEKLSKEGSKLKIEKEEEEKKIKIKKFNNGSSQLKIYICSKDDEESCFYKPILHFSSIKINLYDHFDHATNKFSKEEIIDLQQTRNVESVNLAKRGLAIEMAYIIEKFSITNRNWKNLLKHTDDLTEYFSTDFKEDYKEKIVEKKASPMYGPAIYKNKIIVFHGGNCDLRDKKIQEDSGLQKALWDTEKKEKELFAKEIDKEEMKKLLILLKSIPLEEENKETWYKTFSLSLASYLRFVLFDMGVKLMPYLLIIGPKGEGKSEIYANLLIGSIHKTESTTSETLQKSAIRMYRELGGSTRPKVLDEGGDLTKMKRENIDILKMGATRKLGGHLLRGRRDMKFDNPDFPRNICITANEFKLDDIALQSRFEEILIPNGHRFGNKTLNNKEIIFIKDNGWMIGKELIEICENGLSLKEIKEIVDKYKNINDTAKEFRVGDKKIVLEMGRLLIQKVYDKYEIENEDIKKIKLETRIGMSSVTNIKIKKVMAAVHTLLRKPYSIKEEGSIIDYTTLNILDEFINESSYVSERVIKRIGDDGIFIAGGKNKVDGIFLTSDFLNTLNQSLRTEQLGSMHDLSEIMKDNGMRILFVSSGAKGRIKADKKTQTIKITSEEIGYFRHGIFIPKEALRVEITKGLKEKETLQEVIPPITFD